MLTMCLMGHESVSRFTMSAPPSRQVPRFTTMLRSFAASGSAAEDSSAAQHVQRSALLQRKRAQAASAEVTALHVHNLTHARCSGVPPAWGAFIVVCCRSVIDL